METNELKLGTVLDFWFGNYQQPIGLPALRNSTKLFVLGLLIAEA